jgi:hypothetical protein
LEISGYDMPTLFRLLTFLAFMAALAFGAMWALATFVKPTQTEMQIKIPSEKLNPPKAPANP